MISEDVVFCQNLYAQLPWNESWESSHPVKTFFHSPLINNSFMGFVVKRGTTIVDVSIGFYKCWISGMAYYIDEFFIGRDCHRQGMGATLMTHNKAEYRLNQHSAIIQTPHNGSPLQRFYESYGFTVENNLIILTVGIQTAISLLVRRTNFRVIHISTGLSTAPC